MKTAFMQGKFLRELALFLLLTLAASSAQAQPDNTYNFNPGRPGFAYGSTPLIQHTLSVEAFANVSGQTGKPWNQSGYLVNGYVLRYSPLKNLELGIGTGLAKDWSQKGVSLNPLYLVARINILRKGDNGKPGLALIGQLNFPAGCHSQYAVSRGVIPAATLSVDQSFNNLWVVYNVGADWNAIESNTGLFYCVALGGMPGERLNLYGEFVGDHDWTYADYADPEGSTPARKGQVENTFSLRFGGDYFLTECFKIDLSVGTRLHGPHAMEVELGLAYGIPLKKRR